MLKVLIVDDHVLVRRGIQQILADNPIIVVTGEAGSCNEALDLISKNNYDLVLLDISLPNGNGLEILRNLKKTKPELPVLILTVHTEVQYALRAFKYSASGYITKNSAPEELKKAVIEVSSGGKYVNSAMAKELASRIIASPKSPAHLNLSIRELEVLSMIASGNTIKEIALKTGLSQRTIRTYKYRVRHKIGVTSDLDMIRYAEDNRMLT